MKNINSEALAAQVVTFRLLGLNRDLAIQAMEELYRRKNELNDEFDYEKYISEELDKSPKLQDDNKNILNIIKGFNL